jgi:acyl-coenzyme A synthetase/AMP-(fatty) acid ligase/acyl carrier protein
LHFARVYTNALHIHPDDRLTLLSSYSFDAAKMDIYGALLNGAALYPFNIKKEANLNRLAHWLRDEKITIYHSIPTLYRHFTETLGADDQFPGLRFIVMGGEAVYQRDIEKYRKYSPGNCLFINGLGPTESTVTLQYFLDKNTEITREAIPVGYPVEDTEVFLLNDNNREASMFGTGEIVYKSEYLALGYLNDPAKTDNVFGKNPLTGKDRVYQSGDLGKRLPDGSIEYIGRKDLQVKVRGYRVELGEIESQLLKHRDIKKVVVVTGNMLKQSGNTKPMPDKYICAYIISAQPPASTELREYLSEKLPDYMIPSVFMTVDEIPLTPTGKPNRSALPEPDKSVFKGLEYAAPENETEKLITGIWKEILMLDHVGVNDNFFDLGGTSIDIIKLITKVKEVFSRDVSVVSIYRYTTIRSFSDFFCRGENEPVNHRHHHQRERAVPVTRVKSGRINQRMKRRESRNV